MMPAEIAAGALHLASLLLGTARELPHKGSLSWWDALGIPLERIEEAGHALCEAVTAKDEGRATS
jgi:hypothetical protein